MNIPSLNQQKLNGTIWGSAIDPKSKAFFLDVRDQASKKMEVVRLSLPDLEFEAVNGIDVWWSQLMEVDEDDLIFTEYLDQKDPPQYTFSRVNWKNGEKSQLENYAGSPKENLIYPQVYEHGSDYHKTVMKFLSIDSPLSCEYFEWNNKIIISYYLRSDNTFERYLLALKDGEKLWKIKQDQSMKGFSSGSFFVFQDQLIFIKDLNEVCVYTG